MTHITGKVYDLTQENMNKLIEELEEALDENAQLKQPGAVKFLLDENLSLRAQRAALTEENAKMKGDLVKKCNDCDGGYGYDAGFNEAKYLWMKRTEKLQAVVEAAKKWQKGRNSFYTHELVQACDGLEEALAALEGEK